MSDEGYEREEAETEGHVRRDAANDEPANEESDAADDFEAHFPRPNIRMD